MPQTGEQLSPGSFRDNEMDIENQMVIERTILARDALVAFRRSCLDCANCNGRCRSFFELLTLPESILKSDEVRS